MNLSALLLKEQILEENIKSQLADFENENNKAIHEYTIGKFSMNTKAGSIVFNNICENTVKSIDPVIFALSIDQTIVVFLAVVA
jgi:hypothetical protein